MKTLRLLSGLLFPILALAQAPIQRTPFTTNVTAGPVVSPAWLHVGSLHVTTNATTPSLDVTNNARFQNATASKLAVFDANKYLTNSTLAEADIPTIPKNTMVGTNVTQYRVPMTGDATSTNYVAGPIVSDSSATNASVLGTLTAYQAKATNNLIVGTGTSPGTTMVDIGPAAAGTNAMRVSGGIQTASVPALITTQNWNNAAITFVGAVDKMTTTAAGANSVIHDFMSGASGAETSKLAIRATDGAIMLPSTGAFILDDTGTTAGNPRGNHAVDLQFGRNAATKVASGASSFCTGTNNTASGANSRCSGVGNTSSGSNSSTDGESNTSSGTLSSCFGYANNASTTYAMASGASATAPLFGQWSRASGALSVAGDSQYSILQPRRTITLGGGSGSGQTNTWCELFLDGDTGTKRMTLPSTNSVWTFKVQIAAEATTAGVDKAAGYTFEGVIKKRTTTTSVVGSVTKVVLAEDDANWDARVTADDTNDSLLIEVWSQDDPSRWVAAVTLTQVMAP